MPERNELDARVERALIDLGRETHLLPEQRDHIRNAMVVAATVAARARPRPGARPRAASARRVWLPLGFAFASALALVCGLYFLLGGVPGQTVAKAVSAEAFVIHRRLSGPLSIAWYVDRPIAPGAEADLAQGDVLYAPQPVTLTFPDQSVDVVRTDSEVSALAAGRGLQLNYGRVDMSVTHVPSAPGGPPPFTVDTRRASVTVKGTQFAVNSRDEGDTILTTEGIVEARQRQTELSALIRTGEELDLKEGQTAPLVVQLHAPLVKWIEPSGRVLPDGAATRFSHLTLAGRSYPGGLLTIEPAGQPPITTVVDAGGFFTVAMSLPLDQGVYTYPLRVRAPDGRQRDGQAAVSIDTTVPALTVDLPQVDGNSVIITGRTESGAQVTINSVPVAVAESGQFAARIALPASRTIRVVARDPAANESTLVQVIKP